MKIIFEATNSWIIYPNRFGSKYKKHSCYFQIKMSEEGSVEDNLVGLLPDSEVLGLMRRMTDMNLTMSHEEIQVNIFY